MLIDYFDVDGCIGVADIGDAGYRLDFADGSRLATDAERLHARRESRCAEINAERDRREQAGFPYMGRVFDSDATSVQRLSGAWCTAKQAADLGVDFSIEWTCADNSSVVLGPAEMLGTLPALAIHAATLHGYARALKDTVRASDDPESVDILTGWPE